MPYIRISYMLPKPGQEPRLREIIWRLSAFYNTCDGYIGGYRLTPHEHDESQRVGRVGIWENEEAAVAAAQDQHALSLRSELILAVLEDSHEEMSFEGTPDRV